MMNMNMMNDPALAGMLPFDPMQFYEPPKPRYIFKMPRVVPNQKEKYDADDLFKRLQRDGEVRYTGFRDRPLEERQLRFQTGCREGHTEISLVVSGTNVQLIFNPGYHHHHHPAAYMMERECDFDKEIGKVSWELSFLLWNFWRLAGVLQRISNKKNVHTLLPEDDMEFVGVFVLCLNKVVKRRDEKS